MTIKKASSQRKAIFVAAEINNLISSGDLNRGNKLPSERVLSEKLKVSRSSIREAKCILEGMKVIKTNERGGSYVLSSANLRNTLLSTIEWLEENRHAVNEILDARVAIDQKAAELVAEQGLSTEEEKEIEKKIIDMVAAIQNEDLEGVAKADVEFHIAISMVSKNELIYHLSTFLVPLLSTSRNMLFSLPGRAEKTVEEHRRILDSIISKKPELANKAVKLHTRSVKKSLEKITKGLNKEA